MTLTLSEMFDENQGYQQLSQSNHENVFAISLFFKIIFIQNNISISLAIFVRKIGFTTYPKRLRNL